MKIFILTKFKPLGVREFVDVAKTEKEAMSIFRNQFPYMRGTIKENNLTSDAANTYLLQVTPREI